ncbi:RpoC protein [Bacillus phage SWEP1]|nr:RpoC protein [Bacillus phage SWEP1]
MGKVVRTNGSIQSTYEVIVGNDYAEVEINEAKNKTIAVKGEPTTAQLKNILEMTGCELVKVIENTTAVTMYKYKEGWAELDV